MILYTAESLLATVCSIPVINCAFLTCIIHTYHYEISLFVSDYIFFKMVLAYTIM